VTHPTFPTARSEFRIAQARSVVGFLWSMMGARGLPPTGVNGSPAAAKSRSKKWEGFGKEMANFDAISSRWQRQGKSIQSEMKQEVATQLPFVRPVVFLTSNPSSPAQMPRTLCTIYLRQLFPRGQESIIGGWQIVGRSHT
jgi:hypothetical protein